MGLFYERAGVMELHEYHEFSYADSLRPGGCYTGSDHTWTPTALGGADTHYYSSTMTYPTMPYGNGTTSLPYHLSNNSGKLAMERTASSDYLLATYGMDDRFLPSGIEIMQIPETALVSTSPAMSEYGLFDSCEVVELEVQFYPQLVKTAVDGLARIENFQMEFNFAAAKVSSSGYSVHPRINFTASNTSFSNDPPDTSGINLTQTLSIHFSWGTTSSQRCTITVTGVPILTSTSEWATELTTVTLKSFGNTTTPRKAQVTYSNTVNTEVIVVERNATPLCHCTEGGSFRLTQEYSTYSERTPHNFTSISLNVT